MPQRRNVAVELLYMVLKQIGFETPGTYSEIFFIA